MAADTAYQGREGQTLIYTLDGNGVPQPIGTLNALPVDLLNVEAVTISGDMTAVGKAAADAAVAGNPLLTGGRASTATPSAVDADGDAVPLWLSRLGELMTVIRSGSVTVNNTLPATPTHGQATVTTAGTRVALAGSATPLKSGIAVKALAANTGTIYVGSVTVAAANGWPLAPGEEKFIEVADLSAVYIDASVNAQSAAYIGG